MPKQESAIPEDERPMALADDLRAPVEGQEALDAEFAEEAAWQAAAAEDAQDEVMLPDGVTPVPPTLGKMAEGIPDRAIEAARDELGPDATLDEVVARARVVAGYAEVTELESSGKRPRATHQQVDELSDLLTEARDTIDGLVKERNTLARQLGETERQLDQERREVIASMKAARETTGQQYRLVIESMRVELARMVLQMGVSFEHLAAAAQPAVVDVPTGDLL